MDSVLNKLKEFKKIIYFLLCGVFCLLFLCTFITNIADGVGAASVISNLLFNLCHAAIFALGLIGLILAKDALCKIAFALLLGNGVYVLLVGAWDTIEAFQYFEYFPATAILYYIFAFLTGLVGLAFAFLLVLGWVLGRDDFMKLAGYAGLGYIAMNVLMIIFTIIAVADGGMGWIRIVNAFYNVLFAAFLVSFATSGTLAYEAVEAPAAPAEKKAPAEEVKAEEPKAEEPAEEQPAEETSEAPAEE